MNFNNACYILDLSTTFTDKELRHNYYIKALQYHPDKNSENSAKDKFQEILNAYNYLDSQPLTITSKAHRPAYGDDGDYFSKSNFDDVVDVCYILMHETDPKKYPRTF